MSEKREELLSKVRSEIKDIQKRRAEREERKNEILKEALTGLEILQTLNTEIAELRHYSKLKDVVIKDGGIGGYGIIIHQGNLCYAWGCMESGSRAKDYKPLNDEVVKKFLEDCFDETVYSDDKWRFIEALQRITKAGKEKMAEHILNSLI